MANEEAEAVLSPKAQKAQAAIIETLNAYLPEGNRSDVRKKFIDHMVKNSPAILYSKREGMDGGRHHQALNKLLKDASSGTWRENDAKRTMSVPAMKALAGNFVALNDGLNERAAAANAKEGLSPAAMRGVAKRSAAILGESGAAKLAGRVKEALHLDARSKLNRLNEKEGSDVGKLSKEEVRDLAAGVRGERSDKVADLVDQSGKGAPTAERLADNIVALDKKIGATLGKSIAECEPGLLKGNVSLVTDYMAANGDKMARNPVSAALGTRELNKMLRDNMGIAEGEKFTPLSIGTVRATSKLMQQRDSATLDYLSMAKDISTSAEIKTISEARFGKDVAAQHAGIVKTIEDGGLGEKSQPARRVVLDYVLKNSGMETVGSRDKVALANELGKAGDMPYRNAAERAFRSTGIPTAARVAMSPIRANLGETSIGIQDRDLQKTALAFSELREGAPGRLNARVSTGVEDAKINMAAAKVRGYEDKLEKYFPAKTAVELGGKPITELIREKAVGAQDFESFQKEMNKLRRTAIIGVSSDQFDKRDMPAKVVEKLYEAHKTYEALGGPARERDAKDRTDVGTQGGRLAAAMNAASSMIGPAGVAAIGAASSVAGAAVANFGAPVKEAVTAAAVDFGQTVQQHAIDAIKLAPEVGVSAAASHFVNSVTGSMGQAGATRDAPVQANSAAPVSTDASAKEVPSGADASANNGYTTVGLLTRGAAVSAALYAAYTAKQALDNRSGEAATEGEKSAGGKTAAGVVASAHESAGKAINAVSGQVNSALEYGKGVAAKLPGTQAITGYMNNAQEALGQMTSAARDAVSAAPKAAGEIAHNAAGNVSNATAGVADLAGNAASRVAGAASAARDAMAGSISNVAANSVNAAGTVAGSVRGAASTVQTTAGEFAQTAAGRVAGAASVARDAVVNAASTAGTAMGEQSAQKYGAAAMAVAAVAATAYSMSGKAAPNVGVSTANVGLAASVGTGTVPNYVASNIARSVLPGRAGDVAASVIDSAAGKHVGRVVSGAFATAAVCTAKMAYDSYNQPVTSVSLKTKALQFVSNNSDRISSYTGIPKYILTTPATIAVAQESVGKAVNAVSGKVNAVLEAGKSAIGVGAPAKTAISSVPGTPASAQAIIASMPKTPAEYRKAIVDNATSAAGNAASSVRRAGWGLAASGLNAAAGGLQAVHGAVWGNGASTPAAAKTATPTKTVAPASRSQVPAAKAPVKVDTHANDRNRERAGGRA
jgi:hypothetical protein